MIVSPIVTAILALNVGLQPVPDELRSRVQSIRVRSAQETHGLRIGSTLERGGWRNKQVYGQHIYV
jgi:hypothetical protein